MATSACSLGLLADRTPFITPAPNAAGPRLLNEPGPPDTAGRSRPLTAPNQTPVPNRVDDISGLPFLTDAQVVPSSAAVSTRLPNANYTDPYNPIRVAKMLDNIDMTARARTSV